MKPENELDLDQPGGKYAWYVVAVLTLAFTVSFIDRQILSLLVQPIKRDLGVNDTQIGLLAGFAFALFYSVLGVPIARIADNHSRRGLISIGIVLWSIMTAACGLAKSYLILFLMRVGVGVGEATLSPAAYSIMADYFPPHKLGKAIGVYVMGLYLGAGAALLLGSAVVSMTSAAGVVELPLVGTVYPWQLTFFVVALPGLPLLLLMGTVREPPRREFMADGTIKSASRANVPLSEIVNFFKSNKRFILAHFGGFLLLGTVVSAFMVWVPEFLRRNHGFSIAQAGALYGMILLVFGCLGPYSGGWLAELLRKKGYADAEMRAALLGSLILIPLVILMPLMSNRYAAVVLLAPLTFALSFPQGLVATILQLVAPNRMRAQLTAIFIFLGVLAGYSLGPALVAVCTDYVFGYETAIKYSLALVGGILSPIGALLIYSGLKPYRERMDEMRGTSARKPLASRELPMSWE